MQFAIEISKEILCSTHRSGVLVWLMMYEHNRLCGCFWRNAKTFILNDELNKRRRNSWRQWSIHVTQIVKWDTSASIMLSILNFRLGGKICFLYPSATYIYGLTILLIDNSFGDEEYNIDIRPWRTVFNFFPFLSSSEISIQIEAIIIFNDKSTSLPNQSRIRWVSATVKRKELLFVGESDPRLKSSIKLGYSLEAGANNSRKVNCYLNKLRSRRLA